MDLVLSEDGEVLRRGRLSPPRLGRHAWSPPLAERFRLRPRHVACGPWSQDLADHPSPLAGTGSAWVAQWSMFQDDESFLFKDWMAPATMEDFRDKDVLECGCGGGQHADLVAQVARSVPA